MYFSHVSRGLLGIRVCVVEEIPADAMESFDNVTPDGEVVVGGKKPHPHRGTVKYDYGNGTTYRRTYADFHRVYMPL